MSQVRMPLEVLRVETPCTRDWDGMVGDDRTRYCAGCGLHVHNLSAMPREAAEQLVCERAGRLCVRYEKTSCGRVVTLDYQKPAGKGRRWPFWALLGGVGAVAATAAAALNPFAARSSVIMGGPMIVTGAVPLPPALVTAPDFIGPPAPGAPESSWVRGEAMPVNVSVTSLPAAPLGPPVPEGYGADAAGDPR